MANSDRGFLQALWDFFCSLKLAIFLIIILAITSIIGTIIPQGPPPDEYLQTISQTKYLVYQKLGFFDMYHSWWYILLLYLFTVNLAACSIKRLPRVWKIISEPKLVFDPSYEKTLSLTQSVTKSGSAESLKDKAVSFLSGSFAKPVVTEVNGEYHLFAQKNPYCRLGVYVVHLSIIVVFIGAIIGSLFGFKAFVNITEGSSADIVYSRNNQKPIKLDFALKLEKFTVSFYDTGAPKEFKSVLTVLENGQPVPGYTKRPIVVNSPLTYKGITFYQSSYGSAGDSAAFYFTVRDRKTGATSHLVAHQGDQTPLPGGGYLTVVEATQEVKAFIPGFTGPAAKVEVGSGSGTPQSFIVFKNYPDFDAQRGGKRIFTYDGSDEKYYTGLQVAKDPGVWVVWFGCALMVGGICMAFFMSHKRIWIRVEEGRLVMGGSSSKNPAGFEPTFRDLAEKLKSL